MKNFFKTPLLSIISLTTGYLQSQEIIYSESFDTYSDFSITNIGNWTLVDGDSSENIHFITEGGFNHNNAQDITSFIVFNPSTITNKPFNFNEEAFRAQNGQKYIVNIANYGDNQGYTPNNDWLISPNIKLGNTGNKINFWAKSLKNYEPIDSNFEVGISTTDTDTNSFSVISGNVPISIPNPADNEISDWILYSFDIPSQYNNQSIYISINVVSNSYFLMFDNFTVTKGNILSVDNNFLKDNQFIIYTDTSGEHLIIDNKNMPKANFNYEIINLNAKVVKKGNSNFNKNISIANLTSGIYVLQIKTSKGQILKEKFLKK